MFSSHRHQRLAGRLGRFMQQYARKAQRGKEPNDRHYSRKVENTMRQLSAEELCALLTDGDGTEDAPAERPAAETAPARTGR